jgi:hypothetical protein
LIKYKLIELKWNSVEFVKLEENLIIIVYYIKIKQEKQIGKKDYDLTILDENKNLNIDVTEEIKHITNFLIRF